MDKKAQIWVETVIYTLIALAIIGAVLAFVRPKIQEIQDKAIIEQSIEVMEYIDSKVSEAIRGGSGNTRIVDMGIKKGSLEFDSENDKIIFTIPDTKHLYSEPETIIPIGNVQVLTTKRGSGYDILLTLNYSEKYDLQFDSKEEPKTLSKAPTPYKILFENEGNKLGSGIVIDAPEPACLVADEQIIPNLIPEGVFAEPYQYKIKFNSLNLAGNEYFIIVSIGPSTLCFSDQTMSGPEMNSDFDLLSINTVININLIS